MRNKNMQDVKVKNKGTGKLFARIATVMLTLSLAFALSACGGKGGEDTKGGSDAKAGSAQGMDGADDRKQEKESEVAYSFEGAYASSASDFRMEWVLNLYGDGTLSADPGVVIIDTEEHEEKATGTWSESDGVLKFSIENEDGTFVREYEIEKDENGGYLFGMEVSLSTFVRPIEMRCVTEGFIPAGEAKDSSFN